jgi:hypothetical protein
VLRKLKAAENANDELKNFAWVSHEANERLREKLKGKP